MGGSSTTPTALPIHDTDVSYAHEVEECIPQIAYFETLVTNGKRTSENPQKRKFNFREFLFRNCLEILNGTQNRGSGTNKRANEPRFWRFATWLAPSSRSTTHGWSTSATPTA